MRAHLGNGIYLERQSDGAVRVVVRDEKTHAVVIREAVLTEPEWKFVLWELNREPAAG